MMKSIEGIFRDGKIELLKPALQETESRVLVTFFPIPGKIDLREMGVSEAEAAEMRNRVASFAEDWDRPEMDIYDEM